MLLVDALSCLSSPTNQDTIKLDVRIDYNGFTNIQTTTAEGRDSPGPCTVYRLPLHAGQMARV